MLNRLHYSKDGLLLTEGFESCRLTAYWDPEGKVWTIGFGDTGPDVVEGLVITKDQALSRLCKKIRVHEDFVNDKVEPQLSQGEFDALVDFSYNLGDGSLEHSTLLAKLNQGDFAGAADEFEKWDKAGGHEMAGLLRRRKAEENEFLDH